MPHETEILNKGLAVVKVSRELESGMRDTVNRLRDVCRKQIENGMDLIVDFDNVNICPSLVWGNLLVLAKRSRENERKIVLCCLRPTLQKSVRIIGLNKYMKVFLNRDEAVKALNGE